MKYLIVLVYVLLANASYADEGPIYIDVGQAKVKRSLLAFPSLIYLGTQPANPSHIHSGTELFGVINNDLVVSNLFTTILPQAYLEDPTKVGLKPFPNEPNGFHFEKWKTIGTDFLIRAGYSVTGSDLNFEIYVYHIPAAKMILAKSYKSPQNAYRKLAHTFSNDLIKALTGKEGMYLTKIVASRQENPTHQNAFKEIYVLDWDGENIAPIGSGKTISLSPAWSTAGDKIAYTSFALHTESGLRNADLFVYNLVNHKRFLVSYRKGLNSGAAFFPGDKDIVLTLTKEGNPDIYKMSADGSTTTPLTNGPNHALNVEPAVSPDGQKIAFSSDRSGRPMIWTMNIDGQQLKRLTWAGVYNSTPAWSPDGKTLAIAILDVNHFDIFTLNADGTGLKRLTDARKPNGKPANNESPSWSPDGSHIVFVSDRTDNKQIYIINSDGTNERRITHDSYFWDRPKWSPYLNEAK
jgi:TolB protein